MTNAVYCRQREKDIYKNHLLTFKIKEKIWPLFKVCACQNFKKVPHVKVPVETRMREKRISLYKKEQPKYTKMKVLVGEKTNSSIRHEPISFRLPLCCAMVEADPHLQDEQLVILEMQCSFPVTSDRQMSPTTS